MTTLRDFFKQLLCIPFLGKLFSKKPPLEIAKGDIPAMVVPAKLDDADVAFRKAYYDHFEVMFQQQCSKLRSPIQVKQERKERQ